MYFQCPECGRPLYNRKRPDCEFCGATIPEHLRMTPEQQAALKQQMKDEEKQFRNSSVMQQPDAPNPIVPLGGSLL